MNPTNALKQVGSRLLTFPLLIAAATALALYGWVCDENSIILGWSPFYLKLLTLPLALAFMNGLFPDFAPFNPDDSRDFWKVASISFKLYLALVAFIFLLFRLNRG